MLGHVRLFKLTLNRFGHVRSGYVLLCKCGSG
jgi:hypothetical protein